MGGLNCKACTDYQKQDRGCTKDSVIPNRWEVSGYVSERCPLSFLTADVNMAINAYVFHQKGMTPNNIGWMNESNKYAEVIKFIATNIGEHHGK